MVTGILYVRVFQGQIFVLNENLLQFQGYFCCYCGLLSSPGWWGHKVPCWSIHYALLLRNGVLYMWLGSSFEKVTVGKNKSKMWIGVLKHHPDDWAPLLLCVCVSVTFSTSRNAAKGWFSNCNVMTHTSNSALGCQSCFYCDMDSQNTSM